MNQLLPRAFSACGSHAIGRKAIRALHAELVLAPKPGLVTPFDTGAHDDMDAATFLRSLFALRDYFSQIAAAGARGADFATLQRQGIAAEARMLRATVGINTHRGAIFNLGLIAAAAGEFGASGRALRADALCLHIADRWGPAILCATPAQAESKGLRAIRTHGGRGAREEAAAGYPILRDTVLPALRAARAGGATPGAARVQALFASMAVLDDTNLLHRGGAAGLHLVRSAAGAFLAEGGIFAAGWHERAERLSRACVARHLSPGGSADMLAAAVFLDDLEGFE